MCNHKAIYIYPQQRNIPAQKKELYDRSTSNDNTLYVICEKCGVFGIKQLYSVRWNGLADPEFVKNEIKKALPVWRAVGLDTPEGILRFEEKSVA